MVLVGIFRTHKTILILEVKNTTINLGPDITLTFGMRISETVAFSSHLRILWFFGLKIASQIKISLPFLAIYKTNSILIWSVLHDSHPVWRRDKQTIHALNDRDHYKHCRCKNFHCRSVCSIGMWRRDRYLQYILKFVVKTSG